MPMHFKPQFCLLINECCTYIGLCRWVRAMEVYDRVIKIVAPKRAKLQEAEVELSRQMKRLSEKHTQLQQVRQFICNLSSLF